MNIGSAFPSRYLKASDLQGRTVRVIIDRVDLEHVGNDDASEDKPVIYFQGKEKGMVLNVTNANTIQDAYGPETEEWAGRPLELYVAKVQFQSRMVDGLRVQVPRTTAPAAPPRRPAGSPAAASAPPAAPARPAAPAVEPPFAEGDEPQFQEADIPF